MWLHDLDSHGEEMPSLSKIREAMKSFRTHINERVDIGDKTLHVDNEEVVLTRFNGASKK